MEGTWKERKDAGRALRKAVPRSSHAEWIPRPDRDPIDILQTQSESRIAELIRIRYARMAQSPFAFFRGAAAIMAKDLSTTPVTGIRVQACGDAHVNNFGKFATPERNLLFDINDFDETLPGPWEWDIKRLSASLYIVAKGRGFPPERCARVVATAVRTYRERLAGYAHMQTLPLWYDRIHIEDVIRHFPKKYRSTVKRDIRKALRRDHRRAIAKLTESVDGDPRFLDDPPLLVHLSDTDHEIGDFIALIDGYKKTLSYDRQVLFDRFRLVDVARKVVGVGSVGTSCWVCLFEGPERPGGDHMILQVKEAQASVLEPYVGASAFDHHGLRVVAGQRLTQAGSDIFLGWSRPAEGGREYYVRQLWDVKGQSDPMRMGFSDLSYYGALCAWALARAHARTGDPVVLSGYLGKFDEFDRAVVAFSAHYAMTNEQDHAALLEAIEDERNAVAVAVRMKTAA